MFDPPGEVLKSPTGHFNVVDGVGAQVRVKIAPTIASKIDNAAVKRMQAPHSAAEASAGLVFGRPKKGMY